MGLAWIIHVSLNHHSNRVSDETVLGKLLFLLTETAESNT